MNIMSIFSNIQELARIEHAAIESIKSNIQDALTRESSYTKNGTMISCDNHIIRRNFRLYIDGSYTGEGDYRANCKFLKLNQYNARKLRMFVIVQFCRLLTADYDCSRTTAQNAVVGAFTPDELDKLNEKLVEDALDLIAD